MRATRKIYTVLFHMAGEVLGAVILYLVLLLAVSFCKVIHNEEMTTTSNSSLLFVYEHSRLIEDDGEEVEEDILEIRGWQGKPLWFSECRKDNKSYYQYIGGMDADPDDRLVGPEEFNFSSDPESELTTVGLSEKRGMGNWCNYSDLDSDGRIDLRIKHQRNSKNSYDLFIKDRWMPYKRRLESGAFLLKESIGGANEVFFEDGAFHEVPKHEK